MADKLLKTNRLILVQPKLDDNKIILEFILKNRLHFEKWDPKRDEEYFTTEEQLRRLKELSSSQNQKFYIFKKDNLNEVIGEIGINDISRGIFQNCHISYKLDEDEVGKGIMIESLNKIINYIFEELKLHRIEANIIPTNLRSIRLVEKLGFKQEGLSENFLKINGKWEDHYRYSLINKYLD